VALPQLIVSFPFVIMEALMEGHPNLEAAYESARASYLEEAVTACLYRHAKCGHLSRRGLG
jgi:hypothetical protein